MDIPTGGIVAATLLVLLITLGWRQRRAQWMGLDGRTLWDWLEIGANAVLIGVATIAITATQLDVEASRVQSEAVQSYFDRITGLLADSAALDSAALAPIVRAHTGEVLQVASRDGAGRVLAFLSDLGLLSEIGLTLEEMDLRGAELKGADLSGTTLEDVDLRGADLEGALLRGMELEGIDLRGADLKRADLRDVVVEESDLGGADLAGADLRGADLTRAEGLKDDQLQRVCVDANTALPAGVDGPAEPDACLRGELDD